MTTVTHLPTAKKTALKTKKEPSSTKPTQPRLKMSDLKEAQDKVDEKLTALNSKLEQLSQIEQRRSTLESYERQAITCILGAGIPLTSIMVATIAGKQYLEGGILNMVLSVLMTIVAMAIYSVSLPHIAHAIYNVVGGDKAASWALAVALECGVLGSKLTLVLTPDLHFFWGCWALIIGLGTLGGWLNIREFRHQQELRS